MSAEAGSIPWQDQLQALAHRNAHAVLKAHGIDALDIKPYFSVSRRELIAYLSAHPDLVRSYLLPSPEQRPFHDQLVVEQRGGKFFVYDMYHGHPRGESQYDDLFEAVADFLAFSYAYGFRPEEV
jgi:hypothetical protein